MFAAFQLRPRQIPAGNKVVGSGGAGDSQAWSSLSVIPGASCTPSPVSCTFQVRLPVYPRSLPIYGPRALADPLDQCLGPRPTNMSPNWPRIFLKNTSPPVLGLHLSYAASSCWDGQWPPSWCLCSSRESPPAPPHSSSAYGPQDKAPYCPPRPL